MWAANVKNSNMSKMIQANSLLLNFQMKSPCYLVTLSLESSDFQTFLKQYVILVPFDALIVNGLETRSQCLAKYALFIRFKPSFQYLS